MTTFWENDLDIFFNDFGIDATYGANTIKVIFHNEYEVMTLFGGIVESKNPFLEIKDSDIVGATHSSTITIGGVAYNFIEIRPDGTGITIVELSKD